MEADANPEHPLPTILTTEHFTPTTDQFPLQDVDGDSEHGAVDLDDYATVYGTDYEIDNGREPSESSNTSETSSVYDDEKDVLVALVDSGNDSYVSLVDPSEALVGPNAGLDGGTSRSSSIQSFHTDQGDGRDSVSVSDSKDKSVSREKPVIDQPVGAHVESGPSDRNESFEDPEDARTPTAATFTTNDTSVAATRINAAPPVTTENVVGSKVTGESENISVSPVSSSEKVMSKTEDKEDDDDEDVFVEEALDENVAKTTRVVIGKDDKLVEESRGDDDDDDDDDDEDNDKTTRAMELVHEVSPTSTYSSTSADDRHDSESISSKSSYSSVSTVHQEKQDTAAEEREKNQQAGGESRMSVASLGEHPELNDISLDDDHSREETSSGWGFTKNFPRPPPALKNFTQLFQRPLSTLSPATTPDGEDDEAPGELPFGRTPMSARSFTSIFSSRSSPPTTTSDGTDSRHMSLVSNGSSYDLLLFRLEKENQLMQEDPRARKNSISGIQEIKRSFERVQNQVAEDNSDDDIDWEFWGRVVNDYEAMAKSQPRQLSKTVQKGIPTALRGMIWQLMSKSKESELERTYMALLKETSTHEKLITRDLNRTFPKHEYFKDQNGIGQEGLFNVVKAYSLYDKDVGYCQGLSFVVGPLLLNMPDEEAFCVLVKLMTYYGMRGHFLPGMDGLQQRLYQFERLVEERLPKVAAHLREQGIKSSMYASQWFMTLFAYKFPLSLVFRIYDIVFLEGIEAIFRFSIALLKKNEDKILELEFEGLLDFLKNGLFLAYQVRPTGALAKELIKEYQYNANDFIQDAYNVRITMRKLNHYQQQYLAAQEAERLRAEAEAQQAQAELSLIEQLRATNHTLSVQVKQLEGSLQTLNREHIDLANELVNTKMELAKIKDENDALQQTVSDLRNALELAPQEAEQRVCKEMNTLAHKNYDLTDRNNQLENEKGNLEAMLIEIKLRYAESENQREMLTRKWNGLRKALN